MFRLYPHSFAFNLLFHDIICKQDSFTFHLLFLYDDIPPLFEKESCRNGSVSHCIPSHGTFQSVANRRSHAFSYVFGTNIQSVKITVRIYIAESDDLSFFYRYDCIMPFQ